MRSTRTQDVGCKRDESAGVLGHNRAILLRESVTHGNTLSHTSADTVGAGRTIGLVVSELLQQVYVGLVRPLRLPEPWNLKEEGYVLEAPMVEDAPEALDADLTVADVLVAVTARP